MIYHLNSTLGKTLTGIEHAAILRQKMLKKCNMPSKIVTIIYNNDHRNVAIHGLADSDVVNMYDYFQLAQNTVCKPLGLYDVFPLSTYSVKK